MMDQDLPASSNQNTRPSKITPQARQLNESLYELYKPPRVPTMHIVFFHGFQLGDYRDAHLLTWKSGDDSCIWPQTWLVDNFPDAYILSVSYNALVTKSWERGTIDLFIIGENLVSDLLEANIGQEPHCPVILVGHSFGGLVIKQLCVHVSNNTGDLNEDSRTGSKLNNFLENVKGIFFYATPHHGIPFAGIAAHLMKESPLLEYVKTLSTPAARLNFEFDKLCRRHKEWEIAGLGESQPTRWGRFHGLVVVPEASARHGPSFNVVEGADHISICRPMTKFSRSFNALINLLYNIASHYKAEPLDLRIEEHPENFQHLPKAIVGIDHVLAYVKTKLDSTSSMGFAGMGGVGKTTLAMALFNDLGHHYEYTCFMRDVKSTKGSTTKVILENMHHWGKKIAQKEGGLGFLRGKLLLLILDDVASQDDLEIVSTLLDDIVVHNGSRFIASSRDIELLTLCLAEVYPISFLSFKTAEHLFVTYAFPKGLPPSFVRYANEIVRKCGGLPLTLEVVGKYLYKKSELIWKQAIQALDKAEAVAGFDEKLWAKLQLSYDGLDKVEQDMFLDAATVFYDCDLDSAMAAWSITTNGYQDIRWQHLVDLSLVWELHDGDEILEKGIGMHEQLLSLARKVASSSKGISRWIWDDNQKAWEALTGEDHNLDDVQDIVALRLQGRAMVEPWEDDIGKSFDSSEEDSENDSCEEYFEEETTHEGDYDEGCLKTTNSKEVVTSHAERMNILGSSFYKMGKLRYLSLEYTGIYALRLPSKLVGLRLFTSSESIFFDPNSLKKMALLSLRVNWLTLPATFGQLSSLQMLYIESYRLENLPDSIGHLPMLKYFKIEGCDSLKHLPDTIGKLVTLEYLNISSCSLSTLPDSLGHLVGLKKLVISSCSSLSYVPDSLMELPGLEHVELHDTFDYIIPDLINLKSLKTLRLTSGKYPRVFRPTWLQILMRGYKYKYFSDWTFHVMDGQFVLVELKG